MKCDECSPTRSVLFVQRFYEWDIAQENSYIEIKTTYVYTCSKCKKQWHQEETTREVVNENPFS